MRDNGNRRTRGSGPGSPQLQPIDWVPPEHQVAPHKGFASGCVVPRGGPSGYSFTVEREVVKPAQGPTMLLASPPQWAHRDDLPCTRLVPKGNARDPYDTSDKLKAKALCAGCPVRRECLDDAMAQEMGLSGRSRYLVRGGLTPHQRGRLGSVQ